MWVSNKWIRHGGKSLENLSQYIHQKVKARVWDLSHIEEDVSGGIPEPGREWDYDLWLVKEDGDECPVNVGKFVISPTSHEMWIKFYDKKTIDKNVEESLKNCGWV